MTEAELRRRCGLKKDSLIYSSNLGLLDILQVEDGIITLRVLTPGKLATENVISASVEAVVSKLTANKEERPCHCRSTN